MDKKTPNEHQTLSKSRFKFLIDQVQRKLNQPNLPTDHQESYISSPSAFHFFRRNRILPKYLNNSKAQTLNSKNEKKISVNLQFNKLLLHEKKKFVEHSPNDKDLQVNLPQIKIDSKKNLKTKKTNQLDQTSPRWKLKPLVIERMIIMTQLQPPSLFNSNKKWANLNFDDERKNQSVKKAIKTEVKNRKFTLIKQQNEAMEEIEIPRRYSHKEKRRGLRKPRHKLELLAQKYNIRLENKPKTTKLILSRIKLKVLNLDKLKMSQTQLN